MESFVFWLFKKRLSCQKIPLTTQKLHHFRGCKHWMTVTRFFTWWMGKVRGSMYRKKNGLKCCWIWTSKGFGRFYRKQKFGSTQSQVCESQLWFGSTWDGRIHVFPRRWSLHETQFDCLFFFFFQTWCLSFPPRRSQTYFSRLEFLHNFKCQSRSQV